MKNNKAKLLAVAVAMGISAQASAAIELYNQDGTTFSADGHFNAFFTHTDDEANNEKESRVRMGFLPNWIGFNVSKQIDDLKVGGRSSFWVTINDNDSAGTATAIDVRQFYGTVDGDFGQVLFGKDFGLYARSNIFSDELLLGTGMPTTQKTTLPTSGVTYGNIASGYPYASPVSQITYRSPVNNGFQIAVGVMDPNSNTTTTANSSTSARFETEATYATEFEGGKFNVWINGAIGEGEAGTQEDAKGVGYGASISTGGFKFTASGYDQEGIGLTTNNSTGTNASSDGYLLQAAYSTGANRFVISHGNTDGFLGNDAELNAVAWFHDINSNLKLIAEYDQYSQGGSDVDQFAIGAALSW